jgi:hypothetical protein
MDCVDVDWIRLPLIVELLSTGHDWPPCGHCIFANFATAN